MILNEIYIEGGPSGRVEATAVGLYLWTTGATGGLTRSREAAIRALQAALQAALMGRDDLFDRVEFVLKMSQHIVQRNKHN